MNEVRLSFRPPLAAWLRVPWAAHNPWRLVNPGRIVILERAAFRHYRRLGGRLMSQAADPGGPPRNPKSPTAAGPDLSKTAATGAASGSAGRLFALLGALLALLAVALGAFGAHALSSRLTLQDLATFETAARYQMYHALGLLAVAWVRERWPGPLAAVAGWLLVLGVVVFSGSLYVLVLTGHRWLGALTPVGGVCMMLGWACLALAVVRGE